MRLNKKSSSNQSKIINALSYNWLMYEVWSDVEENRIKGWKSEGEYLSAWLSNLTRKFRKYQIHVVRRWCFIFYFKIKQFSLVYLEMLELFSGWLEHRARWTNQCCCGTTQLLQHQPHYMTWRKIKRSLITDHNFMKKKVNWLKWRQTGQKIRGHLFNILLFIILFYIFY